MIRALFIILLLASSLSASINRGVMLDTIADIETGNRNVSNGLSKGTYQMMPVVRRAAGGHDRAAASRWLNIVISDMEKSHIDINSFNVALVWRAGITSVRKGSVPEGYYDYALRASQLYGSRMMRGKKITTL